MLMMMMMIIKKMKAWMEAWSLEARRLAYGLDANMAAVLAYLKMEQERNRYQHFHGFSDFQNRTHWSCSVRVIIRTTAAWRDQQGTRSLFR